MERAAMTPDNTRRRLSPALEAVRARWAALSGREQRLLAVAGSALILLLAWSLAVAPALRTLREMPAQQRQAQAALDQMAAQAAQAQALRAAGSAGGPAGSAPRSAEAGVDDATRELLAGLLGKDSRLEAQGRQLTLTFSGASAAQLRQALQSVRTRLRVQLIEAELTPAEQGIRGRLRYEWLAD